MQVLVADKLIKQTKGKRMPSNIVAQIYKELEIIIEQASLGYNSLNSYLLQNNGKEMKGKEDVYKFRLNSGDRILYTWAKNLSYLRDMDENALVVFAYSKHDPQGRIPLPSKQPMVVGEKVFQVFNDLEITTDDLEAMDASELESVLEIFDKDYMIAHSFYMIDPNDYEDRDPDVLDVYLSDEQNEKIEAYLKKPNPLMIIGGAGTGKTIMATHLLNSVLLYNDDFVGGYFTQSRELLNKIKSQYEYISKKDRDRLGIENSSVAEFFNLNDLMMKKLNLSSENLVKTEEFLRFVEGNAEVKKLIHKFDITPIDLWTEIRGTIKGGLGADGYRYSLVDRQDCTINGEKILHLAQLIGKNALVWKDNRHFSGVNDIDESDFSLEERREYGIIKGYFSSVDPSIRLMEKEEYLLLKEERSTLEKDKREVAYKICCIYQEWLGNDKFDENDLACMFLNWYEDQFKYDVVIVDEVQDYTEIQIYVLKKLVKKIERFVMAGDAHQIVNPTAFSEQRMYTLIGNHFYKEILQKNFRCQKEIVRVVNGLNVLRNRYVAKDKGSDRDEYSSREGETPRFIDYSGKNLKNLVLTLMDYPGVAILVPNNDTKTNLVSLVGEKAYAECPEFIFTVADIKGMEYKYVVCVNMISAYENSWLSLLGFNGRRQTKYRYYFNLFYVAITRAQKYLCFIEKNSRLPFYSDLEKEIGQEFEHVKVFSKEDVWIDELQNNIDEWLRQAHRYEENGNYKLAVENYRKANASQEDIIRCEMKRDFEDKKYEESLTKAIELGNQEYMTLALESLNRTKSNKSIMKLGTVLEDMEVITNDDYFKENKISQLIDEKSTNLSEERREDLAIGLISELSEILFFQAENLREMVSKEK